MLLHSPNVASRYSIIPQNKQPSWLFYPFTPCAMFRQMFRPALRPVLRSSPPRTQNATRAIHTHTHSSKRHPRSPTHRCCRVPIQSSSVLLQLGPLFPNPSYAPSSSRPFHSSRRVQGIYLIGMLSALKVRLQPVAPASIY